MIRPQPRFTLTDTLFPTTTLCRSARDPAADLSLRRSAGRPDLGGGPKGARHVARRRRSVMARHLGDSEPGEGLRRCHAPGAAANDVRGRRADRSEEHTSELQSLMRISYAVFCLKKTKKQERQ